MGEGSITVWCLLGKKVGDNTQVRALAGELGWGYEEKHIAARPWPASTGRDPVCWRLPGRILSSAPGVAMSRWLAGFSGSLVAGLA